MRRSHWFEQSRLAIEAAIAELPADADKRTISKAVAAAYPFGERKRWPYLKWCEAQAQVLWQKFPKLFPDPRRRRKTKSEPEADVPGQMFLHALLGKE
jgi:hypothetical protein